MPTITKELKEKAFKIFLNDFKKFEKQLKKEQKEFQKEFHHIKESISKIRKTNGVL